MKYGIELSRLILLDEYGGIMFCGDCGMIIGYINEKGYKNLKMALMCECGSTGCLRLSRGRSKISQSLPLTEKKLDVVNNVYVCGECGTQLFEIDGKRVESCSFEAVCTCGACYNGKSMFFRRLGETAHYLKQRKHNGKMT